MTQGVVRGCVYVFSPTSAKGWCGVCAMRCLRENKPSVRLVYCY